MSAPEGPPRRVTVTHPRTAAARRAAVGVRRPGAQDVREQNPVGELYVRSLVRAQLRLSLAVLVGLATVIGLLPLAGVLIPAVQTATVGPLPVAWLLLAVAVFPALAGTAWWYVRAAEQTERQFVDLVERR